MNACTATPAKPAYRYTRQQLRRAKRDLEWHLSVWLANRVYPIRADFMESNEACALRIVGKSKLKLDSKCADLARFGRLPTWVQGWVLKQLGNLESERLGLRPVPVRPSDAFSGEVQGVRMGGASGSPAAGGVAPEGARGRLTRFR